MKNEKILIGNTFPLVLVRRRVVIEPCEMSVLKKNIYEGVEVFSFWGHVGTLEVANSTVGADLAPRTERPALQLTEDGLPMLYGQAFHECFVLSPNYIGGFRPALGVEVTAEQISSWNLLRVVFE